MYPNKMRLKRLKMRKLQIDDIDIWKKFFINNSSLKYLGLDLNKEFDLLAEEWIEHQFSRYENNRHGHLALIDLNKKQFIGQAGLLTQQVDGTNEIEIGYHIIPEFWGKGYATEAALYLRHIGFENYEYDSLVSVIDIRNKGSQNVAVKTGMKIEKQLFYNGLDVYLYRINRDEYNLLKK